MGRNLQEQPAQAGEGPIDCTSKQTQDQTNVDLTTEGAGAKHSGHYNPWRACSKHVLIQAVGWKGSGFVPQRRDIYDKQKGSVKSRRDNYLVPVLRWDIFRSRFENILILTKGDARKVPTGRGRTHA